MEYIRRGTGWYIAGLTICTLIFSFLPQQVYATDYSSAFQIDSELCYSLTNYYGQSYTKRCFASSWEELFAQDGYYDRAYFSSEYESFVKATTNGKGAVAVTNTNRDRGNNDSNPYFISIYWVEDNSNGASKMQFAQDGSSLSLSGGRNAIHYAEISSSKIVQGGQSRTPSYLWGDAMGGSFTLTGTSDARLFFSSFPVEYPQNYNGPTIPTTAPDVPYEPAFDYSHAFKKDEGLCYSLTNYYGMTLNKQCYADSWQNLFVQDRNSRPYFDAEKASFERAQTNGKGAWAVTNVNTDNGDNTSSAYFITLYWVEDNSSNNTTMRFSYDGDSLYLSGDRTKVHYAIIGSPRVIQGLASDGPSYLWGGADGGSLSLYGSGNERLFYSTFPVVYPNHYNGQVVPGSATPGTETESIGYLALGDSFSSGEGDTERQPNSNLKYYREHTDDDGVTIIGSEPVHDRPTEKCHLSTRSYPYILANGMDLGDPTTTPNSPWQSVACSGATAWDVKELGTEDYAGQNKKNVPRLKGFDVATLKNQALNEFIPGRQKQIEFVKKYQPKVITLTMGGNDVDFSGKIINCASLPWRCDYANLSWREKIRNELTRQFDNLSSLYAELDNAAEGKSKIYVLGYPVFINGNPYAKCTNIFNLDNTEREFINNSIIYLNNIIHY